MTNAAFFIFFFIANFSLTQTPALQKKQKLEWFAISPQDINNNRCLYDSTLEPQDRMKFISHHLNKDPLSAQVQGVNFVDESPELIYRFKQLTSPSEEFGPGLERTVPPLTQRYPELKKCNKVVCALGEIFGPTWVNVLYLLMKYDINVSHLAFINASPMSLKETEVIIRAMTLVPHHLQSFSLNQKLIRFKIGFTRAIYGSKNVIANASMEFFDLWPQMQSSEKMILAAYHEFAHNWSTSLSHFYDLDTSKEWLIASGWDKISQKDKNSPPPSVVSIYGSTKPGEDFAETASLYRFGGARLKQISPSRYEYMKNYVYGGIEFLDGNNCQAKSINLEMIQSQAQKIVASEKLFRTFLQENALSCSFEVATNPHPLAAGVKLRECLNEQLIRDSYKFATGRYYETLPRFLYDSHQKRSIELFPTAFSRSIVLSDLKSALKTTCLMPKEEWSKIINNRSKDRNEVFQTSSEEPYEIYLRRRGLEIFCVRL